MNSNYRKYAQAGLLVVSAWLVACSGDSGDGSGNNAAPQLVWPLNGWETASPEDHRIDSEKIAEALDYAFQAMKNTQGVVIVRNGVIVAERYAEDRDADSYATSWSVAKSFTSALIGIALEEGKIDHVDVSLAEIFPAWRGTDKEAITLRHALQMASGKSSLGHSVWALWTGGSMPQGKRPPTAASDFADSLPNCVRSTSGNISTVERPAWCPLLAATFNACDATTG